MYFFVITHFNIFFHVKIHSHLSKENDENEKDFVCLRTFNSICKRSTFDGRWSKSRWYRMPNSTTSTGASRSFCSVLNISGTFHFILFFFVRRLREFAKPVSISPRKQGMTVIHSFLLKCASLFYIVNKILFLENYLKAVNIFTQCLKVLRYYILIPCCNK